MVALARALASGTPASAAYTDEAYAMPRKGQAETALGICLWFSALGGIAGTLSLMLIAPLLAEMALSFSTYENFWLAMLGLARAPSAAEIQVISALFLVGAATGFVYWVIAGRGAGGERADPARS